MAKPRVLVQKPGFCVSPANVENPIWSKMTTNLIGFQPLKMGFFGFFEDGARSELYVVYIERGHHSDYFSA